MTHQCVSADKKCTSSSSTSAGGSSLNTCSVAPEETADPYPYPYPGDGANTNTNANVFSDGVTQEMTTLSGSVAAGYTGQITLSIAI